MLAPKGPQRHLGLDTGAVLGQRLGALDVVLLQLQGKANNGLSQGMCGSVFLEGKQWKEWEGRLAVGYAGIGIHGTPTGNRIDILDISKDGIDSTRQELSWPTFAGRLRHLSLGPDNALYVADEASGMIYRVTPN